MKSKTAARVAKLLERVLKLQRNAPEGIFYTFDYSGLSNSLYFWKFRKEGNSSDALIQICCYPGEIIGMSLDDFEKHIAKEEKECGI